ncbi:MAG: hypothetical protein ACR2QM_03740 [Longimicrobiales bacterium]
MSILLAFSIDAWWERRQERSLETEALESLLVEFEANQERLRENIDRHDQVVTAAIEIHDRIQAAEPGSLVPVADTLLFWVLRDVSFESQEGALTALLQSGDLGRVRNPELRDALAGWPARLADATENEFVTARDLRPPLLTLVSRQVDLRRVIAGYSRRGALTTEGTVSLVASQELANRLIWLGAASGGASGEEQEAALYADRIVGLLQVELAR